MAEESTRAPQALREEEAFLALAETLSALIALIQGDKLVYVNPAGAAILGYPQDYYKGRNFWDFALPEDRATIIERGRTRQQGVDHPRRFTERLRHADGRILWVDYSVDVIQLNGKTTTLVTGHDITDRKKAEEAVCASEALFRQLFTQSPVMICSIDKQDRLCRASDHWLNKLGYTQEEVIGTNGYQYLTPESIQRLGAALQEKIQKKEWLVKDVPLKTIRKDGTLLDILVTSVAKFDDKGEHDGWITVAQDISEINGAQKALFQSEERFRAAFKNAVIGKAVTGADLKFVQVNRAFCEMLGYSEAEFLGKTPRDFTHPDDIEQGRKFVDGILSGEKESCRQTKRYLHKDGRTVWVDMTATLVRDPDGKPSYFVTEVIDITERKNAEELLKDREAKLAESQKLAHVGHWYFDAATAVTTWSAEIYRMLGVDPADPARPLERSMEMYHPDDRDRIARLVQATLEEGLSVDDESRIRDARGNLLWIHSIWYPRRDSSGKIIGIYGVTQDITERKRAEQLLRDHEAKLEEAQRIAHLGSWEHDIATGQSRASAELYRIAGLDGSTTHHTMEQFLSCVHPDDAGRVTGLVRRAMAEGVPYEYEARFIFAKDRVRWLHAIGRVDKDPSTGKPTRLYGVAQDITDRKVAEELLKDREAKLAEAQQIAKLGRWEWDVDKDVVTWSEEMYKIFGITPQEFEGNYQAVFSRIQPDDRARIAAQVADSVEDGKPHQQEYRAVWPNGEMRHVAATNQSVLDASGRVVRMYGVAQDITERKLAEAKLRDREAKLAEAQKVGHIGSWEYNPNTNSSIWSEEMFRLFGVDPAKFNPARENAFSRMHPDHRERIGAIVDRAIRDGSPYEFEMPIVLDNGQIRTLWVIGKVNRDASGKTATLFGVCQDITERKRSEELLRDREAKLAESQKIAHVGHWEYDQKTNSILWSDAMYEIWGADRATFDPRIEAVISRIHPKDRERTWRIVEAAMQKGSPFEYEYDVVRDNGELRSLWSRGQTDLDASGKPARFYGITQDITERKKAENLLKEREAALAEAQKIAHVGSWDWDVLNGRVAWSDELFRILGLDPARSTASFDGYVMRVHADDRAAMTEQIQQGLADGLPFESEHRICRDSGAVRVVWTSCRMEKDASGKVVRMYGTAQDVTERKQAEDALRTSESRFRNLYTQAPVMMIAFGSDNRIREVSNYWLKVMGYERQEVVGQEGSRFITADSHQRLFEAMEQTVREGERVLRSFPLAAVRKDGRTLDILCTSVIEMDEWGHPLGAIAVGVDVSDIRRAEEAVRESEARYRAMVEYAPEAIVVHDVDAGMFWDVNEPAVRLFGRTKEDLLKLSPVDCSPEFQPNGRSSAEMAREMIGRTFAGDPQTFEWVHLGADGRKIPCLIRLSTMPARNRNLLRATITDISDQKALEEKIRHAEKMAAIGLLAAGVAHEIGNPLLALSMAAQSLERKSTDEYAQKKLGLIREHIDRISKIVRQMSDLARPQSVQKSPCDVNRVLERTLEVVRYDKRAKDIPIKFDPCPDVPFVQAVEDQLTQVCLNLALNALDAMAANPPSRPKSLSIQVRCVKKDGRSFVRASFADMGPGIPEAARSKIFQPFYTTKATGKGTGLGLSVSYRIIQEHRGMLAFECGPKDGTEFFFELPV